MTDPREQITHYAAWMEMRAQSHMMGLDGCIRAKTTADWLHHWLGRSGTHMEASICSFLLDCAEQEILALASPHGAE